MPAARRDRGTIVLGKLVDERGRGGAFLGTMYPDSPFFTRPYSVSLDGKSVSEWTRGALEVELEQAGFHVVDTPSTERSEPRLDGAIRVFHIEDRSLRDEPPSFITTIAVHMELRIAGDIVLKKNYLCETLAEGESVGFWITDASVSAAMTAGTRDMTPNVVRDVGNLIECGSIACTARSSAPASLSHVRSTRWSGQVLVTARSR